MKLNKFLTLAIFLLLPGLLSGCKDDAPVAPEETNIATKVSFTLALPSEATRATTDKDGEGSKPWTSGSDEAAVGIDNKIETMRVVLYSVTNNTLDIDNEIGELRYLSYDRNDHDGTVEVTGYLITDVRLSALDDDSKHYRLAVFVNPPAGTDGLNINNPAACTFNEHGTSITTDEEDGGVNNGFVHGLPMYGVSRVKFTGLSSNHSSYKTFTLLNGDGGELSVPILRSVAKVKVNVDSSIAADKSATAPNGRSVKLVSMTISRHASKGYLVPTGWNTVDNLATETTSSSVMNAFKETSESNFDRECTVRPYTGENKQTWMNSETMLRLYCPDTYNGKNDGLTSTLQKPIQLTLKYTCDCGSCSPTNPHVNYLYFCDDNTKHDMEDHKNHTPWDIIRNHIYEYNITGIADNFSLKCEVNIKPWGYVKINGIELGDDGKSQSSN